MITATTFDIAIRVLLKLADVFISYAREDREFVSSLASNLEAAGLTVWWDRNISGGAEFAQTIEQELMAASTAIVVWSANALSSHWVRDEADFAREQDKLLPLSLDGAMAPLGFRQLHALGFESTSISASDGAFLELLSTLGISPSEMSADDTANIEVRTARPGLMVVPFAGRSNDDELEFIAQDLTEDMVTMLASFGHIRVTTKKPSKGQQEDGQQSGKTGDIRYLVEGSVRKSGPKLRITVQLLETATDENIWARKFDQPLEEFSENPDDVVEKICGSLYAQLISAEAERAEFAPPDELGAWEYCQRAAKAIPQIMGSMEGFSIILNELETALRVQPDYALAHAISSWGYIASYINGLYTDIEQANLFLSKFDEHLRKARSFAQDDLLTQTYIGAAENYSGQQSQAIHTLEKVLSRNPANADAWYMICMPYTYLGRFDEARHAIARADELSPEAGYSAAHEWYMGILEFMAGNIESAKPKIERLVLQSPNYGYACCLAAMCSHLTSDQQAARRYIALAKQNNPYLTPKHVEGMLLSQSDEEKGERDAKLLRELWD